MSRSDGNPEETPRLPDPRELYRQMEEEQQSEKAPLPDPAELFRQMEAEEQADQEVPSLPDPALLYQQLEEDSYGFPEADTAAFASEGFEEDLDFDIPDPDSADSNRTITVTLEELEARRRLEEAEQGVESEESEFEETGEPPDMAALLQASLSEVEDEVPLEEEEAPTDLPDPAALFAELEEEAKESEDPQLEPEKAPSESELDEDPEVAGFFANLTNRFNPTEPEVEAEPPPLRLPEIIKPAPVLSQPDLEQESEPTESRPLPSPEELFQQLKAEENEAESAQESSGEELLIPEEEPSLQAFEPPPTDSGDSQSEEESLPALPDLEAFKQELEDERRAHLDPDLDTDLSGPERFAQTVSDSVFRSEQSLRATFAPVPEPEPEPESKPEPSPPPSAEPTPATGGDILSNEDFLAELEADVSEPESPVGPTGTIKVDEEKVAAEIFQEQEAASKPLLRHPTDAPPPTSYQAGGKKARSKPKSKDKTKKTPEKKKPGKRFSRYKLALFTRQMAVMLKAGIQLHQSVAFAADSDPEMEPLLKQVLQKLESGYSFSNAIADSSRSFDTVYVGLIQAGELSGRLHEMLARLADVLEREIELRKRLISVITYPTVLLTVSFMGTLGFIFFVLPTLTPLFKDLGVALPLPTRILLASRDFIIPTFAVAVLSIILLVLTRDRISDYIKERPTLERKFAAVPFSIPVIGDVYEKVITARVLYSLSTMLDVGITLNQALARAEVTSGNALTSYRLGKARMDLADGLGVTDCFRLNNLFNPSALHLISAGEEAAKLADMFQYVAKLFDEEVEYALESASSILEPLIMVVMGFIVGFITIAAALPTIQLLQNFS